MAEATYSYGQLADWYAKHGGSERGRKPVTVQVPNPGYDGITDQRQTIPSEAIEITAADGSTIVVQEQPVAPDPVNPNPQPQYIVHSHMDVKPPANANDPGNQAADANAVELQRQRERNAALPPEQDPAYETDAERRARGRQTALDQEAKAARDKAAADAQAAKDKAESDKNAANARAGALVPPRINPANQHVEEFDPATNTWVDKGPVKEKVDIRPDGQGGYVQVKPDGTVTAVTVQGQGTDPTFVGSMPSYVPKPIADDLKSYSEELAAAVKSGAITPARATALMDARLKAAQSAANNEIDAAKTIYSTGVQQRGQDQQMADSRLTASGANFRQALTSATSINDWVNPGSDAGWRLFQALLAQGQEQARQYGGLADIPREPVPAALQRAAGITITSPDGTVVTVPHPGGAPTTPQTPAMAPVVDPNSQTAPAPPAPGMGPADLLGSMRAPQTGVGAVDAMGQQMAQQRERPPLTFDSMEEAFRKFGMDEDAIQQSRRNFMGAGVA